MGIITMSCRQSPIDELIWLKHFTGGGGSGDPVVRVRFIDSVMIITNVSDITSITYEDHVLTMS